MNEKYVVFQDISNNNIKQDFCTLQFYHNRAKTFCKKNVNGCISKDSLTSRLKLPSFTTHTVNRQQSDIHISCLIYSRKNLLLLGNNMLRKLIRKCQWQFIAATSIIIETYYGLRLISQSSYPKYLSVLSSYI